MGTPDIFPFPPSVKQNGALANYDEGLTGRNNMTVSAALRGGTLLASRLGLRLNNSAASEFNTIRLQSTLNDIGGIRNITFDTDELYLEDNILPPVGVDQAVDLCGLGWNGPRIIFYGPTTDKGFYFQGSDYSYSGGVYDMNILGFSGPTRGVTFEDLNHPRMERCLIRQFAGAAVKYDGCLLGHSAKNLYLSNGSLTECAVEVTGADANTGLKVSTHFQSLHDRISGGLAGGSAAKKGGYSIDRTSVFSFIGSQTESTGVPIHIGSQASAVRGCFNGQLFNMGLENPADNLPYIDVGQGWTGAARGAMEMLTVDGINASPSGAIGASCGMRLKDTVDVEVRANVALGLLAGAVASYDLVGTGNVGFSAAPSRRNFGNLYPWVRENGVMRPDATPYMPFLQHQTSQGLHGVKTVTGVNPSLAILAAQGGYYANIYPDNPGAVTMITLSTGRLGAKVRLIPTNNNTTLQHGTGTDQFNLLLGVNLLMMADKPYTFWHNGTSWKQET